MKSQEASEKLQEILKNFAKIQILQQIVVKLNQFFNEICYYGIYVYIIIKKSFTNLWISK